MEDNKQNLMDLINEIREWNKQWNANPTDSSLKSVDEFAEELDKKYTLNKK